MSGSGGEPAGLQGLFASLRASSHPNSAQKANSSQFDGAAPSKPPTQPANPNMSRNSTPGPTGSQSSNLLGLLKFGAPAASPQPNPQQQPPATPRSENIGPSIHSAQGRGISASDLVASLKAGGTSGPPPQEKQASSTSSIHQDSLLKLLNQTAASSEATPKGIYGDKAGSQISQTSAGQFRENENPLKSRGSASASLSPFRFFGGGENAATTPFEPETIPSPSPKNGPLFTYVNPFEQLAASSPRNAQPKTSTTSDIHKRKIKSPSPAATHTSSRRKLTPSGSGSEVLQNSAREGGSHLEALMGIGAPSRDAETVAQALDEVGDKVNKQVETALAEAEGNNQKAKVKEEGKDEAEAPKIDVMEEKIQDAAIEVKAELDKEENKHVLEETMPPAMAEAVKEVIDDAAQGKAADDWESAEGEGTSSKAKTVANIPVHQFPLRPFVSIDLVQKTLSDITIREDSVVNIARFKKDFDQADRTLATATSEFIAYSVPKNGGLRVIQQDNGNSNLLFANAQDRIFNVGISTAHAAIASRGPQRVIATGVSGIVYWTTLGEDDSALSRSEMESQSVIFPPTPATSSGQLKTRAKKSSRHPEFFAIGRGKSIHIVFPGHARNSEYFGDGSMLDSEKYFHDRSLKISIGKASKDFAFSEDDSTIVTLDKAGKLRIWDVRDLVSEETQAASKLAPVEIKTPLLAFTTFHSAEKSWPTSVLFVDKIRPYTKGTALRYIVVGMKQNHTLQLWDLCLGKAVQELNFPHDKETDAICSVNYHPGTGIIAVGHPTRNSIYFIHLSAPKYNLPSMSQARLVQRLANKDSTLPKAEATAIMSGLREYSFANKGQLRSVELVSSSTDPAKVDDDEEDPTLFELYIMHSKGVTCLTVKREDLGWAKDGRPLQPVDAKEEGLIIIKDLREPLALPPSEPASVNGDSLASGTPSKPAPKKSAKESEKAEVITGDLPTSKSPEKTEKTEKADKKKTKSNGPADGSSHVTTSSAPASYANASQRAPAANAQTAAGSSKGAVRPSLSKHASRDAPETWSAPTQDGTSRSAANGEPISLGISGDFLDKELKKIEQGVSGEFNKVFGRELETLYRRIADDKRVQDAAGAARQEAVLRLVSSQLGDNVEKSLSRIIMKNFQESVLPSISDVTGSSLEKQLPKVVSQQLQHIIPPTVRSALPEAIDRTMKEPDVYRAITESITKAVTGQVEREFSTVLQKSIIPTFSNLAISSAQKIAGDTEHRVREQLKQADVQRRDDGAKIDQLTNSVRVLSETVHQMAAAQSDFQQEILRLQHRSAQDNQVLARRDSPTPSESASMHVSQEQEELNTISNLMQEGRFEEGTIMWLQSNQQQALFDQIFLRCNPSYLRQISPLVVLSVGAALTASLETNLLERLAWLETVFASLHPAEHDIQAVAPKVLEVLSQRLQAEYMSIAEGEQHHPALHRIALLARKARDLMHSFPEVRE